MSASGVAGAGVAVHWVYAVSWRVAKEDRETEQERSNRVATAPSELN